MTRKHFYLLLLLPLLEGFPAAAAPPQLHVSGNQLLTSSGCNVRLKGVNVNSLEYNPYGTKGPPGQGITATVAEAVTAWNANIIRLPLSQDYWFGCTNSKVGGNPVTAADYQALVQSIVNYCSSQNVYVILDLHWSGAQTGATAPCGTGWGAAVSQRSFPDDNSVTFWSSLAGTPWIQNNPSVLFDLYNEPFDYSDGNAWTIWRDGGNVTGNGGGFHTPGMQNLLNTVRTAGAGNIAVVGGLDYAYDLTGVAYNLCGGSPCAPTDNGGNGIIYSAHIYPGKGSNPWVPLDGDGKISPAAFSYPVLVGEFGQGNAISGYTPNPDTNGTWDQTLLNWIDGNNSASYQYNFTAWNMTTTDQPDLLANWSFTPTTYHGVPVMNELATRVPTCPPTPTPTSSPTPCGYPGNTCTPTNTPTATATPVLGDDIPWPNPWDGSQPVSLYHTLSTPADAVHLKVYTLSFRLIYDDGTLYSVAGHPVYDLTWNQVGGNLANGLYYLVIEEWRGSDIKRTILKLMVLR